MTDPILEEVYTARKQLWDLGGGTLSGFCAYLRTHPLPDPRYAKRQTAQSRHPSVRTLRNTARKSPSPAK